MSISALDDLTREEVQPLIDRHKAERKALKQIPYHLRQGAGAYLNGFELDKDYDYPNPNHPMYGGNYLKGWQLAQRKWPRADDGCIYLTSKAQFNQLIDFCESLDKRVKELENAR